MFTKILSSIACDSSSLSTSTTENHETRSDQERKGNPPAVPSSAQVVICGGGVVGASVAYHLPKYGFKDVLLLEQGR